ncbi:MAG: hypothetical protein ACOC1P_00415 [Minisyncoccales bacterium]
MTISNDLLYEKVLNWYCNTKCSRYSCEECIKDESINESKQSFYELIRKEVKIKKIPINKLNTSTIDDLIDFLDGLTAHYPRI